MKKLLTIVLMLLATAGIMNAQEDDDEDLSATLGKVTSAYAQAYITPLSNTFGANLNSGLFHTASVGSNGFHLYFGVKAFGAFVSDEDKKFSLSYQDNITVTRTIGGASRTLTAPATFTVVDAPTVFGDETKAVVTGTATIDTTIGGIRYQETYTETDTLIGGLINTSIAPLAMPQIGLGTVFGTDVMLRYLPTIDIGTYGSVGFVGVGIRHNVSQYLPSLPFDLAVQFSTQKLTVKDSTDSEVLGASARAFNVEISKSFSVLTVYGGLQMESSNMNVSYTYTPEATTANPTPTGVPINFEMDGSNTFRGLVGINLGLGPLKINADYSLGTVSVVSAGLGFGF